MAVILNKRTAGMPRKPVAGRAAAGASLPQRVLERFPAGELISFATIGLVCTALFLVAYDLARPALPPLAANVVALSSTAGLNFLANRMFTFRGRERRLAEQAAQYFAFYLVGLGVSSAALFCFLSVWIQPPHIIELAGALSASGLATIIRYVAMTLWVFPRSTNAS